MTMTLEQVRDWHRAREASFANSKSKLFSKEDARAKRKHRQMADAIDAHLAHLAQPAQSVDEMVLVPVEPTQAMLEAMAESYWGETWNAPGMGDDRLIDARNMYDEALTAALRKKGNG